MRDAFMAVNTGLPCFSGLIMHFRRHRFLGREIHVIEVMAVAALLRVIGFHAPPLVLRHFQPVIFELGGSIDNAENLTVKFFTGLNFTDHFRAPFVRHMAVRTGGAHTAAVVVMHRFHIFLVNVIAHFMTTDAERFGVGLFHTGVEAAPEKDPRREADKQQRGAARHAKMLDTDQAWEVFEQLEDCYFHNNVCQPTKLTDINDRIPLANAVGMLVGKSDFNTKEVYDMLQQRFSVNHVNQIPLQLLPSAVEYVHNLTAVVARSNQLQRQDQYAVQQLVEAVIQQNFKMMGVWNALRYLNPNDFFTYSGLIVRSNQLALKLSKRYNLKGENGEPLISQNFRQVSFSNGELMETNPNWFNAEV